MTTPRLASRTLTHGAVVVDARRHVRDAKSYGATRRTQAHVLVERIKGGQFNPLAPPPPLLLLVLVLLVLLVLLLVLLLLLCCR